MCKCLIYILKISGYFPTLRDVVMCVCELFVYRLGMIRTVGVL